MQKICGNCKRAVNMSYKDDKGIRLCEYDEVKIVFVGKCAEDCGGYSDGEETQEVQKEE